MNDGKAIRMNLVRSCLGAIVDAHQTAQADGKQNPVVVLVDMTDEFAGRLAREWVDNHLVDQLVEARRSGQAPENSTAVITTMAFEKLRRVGELFPEVKKHFTTPPPVEEILLLVMAAGGRASTLIPLSGTHSDSQR